MSTEAYPAARRREVFFQHANEIPRRKCETCGQRFFTGVGLDEHVRLGQHGNLALVRSWVTGRMSPQALSTLRERGRRLAEANNARRRSCLGCGHVSTPAAIGSHQRASGHTGWTEVTP